MKVYQVYTDDHEPWEYNRYNRRCYLYEEDAIKAVERLNLQFKQEDNYYSPYASYEVIEVIDRKEDR